MANELIGGYPKTPAGQPPAATDVVLIGRVGPPGSPGDGYAVPLGMLSNAVRPVMAVAATGAGALAGRLKLGVNLVTAAASGGQLQLPALQGSVTILSVLNDATTETGVLLPSGALLGTVAPGIQVELHSADGVAWVGANIGGVAGVAGTSTAGPGSAVPVNAGGSTTSTPEDAVINDATGQPITNDATGSAVENQ